MNTTTQTSSEVNFSAVTDRGLNERRPLNEDSYLAAPESHIFAVADGVGGAEAGEVASQTAIEVLAEAFKHHRQGEDVEDLMEIAIQRANQSIYNMARENPQLASMATTVVALHLDGNRATIGHVGDSRVYIVTPDGKLHRETNDHSMVEDEVRAGRMTAEEALTHPSRNIINRALGAEANVEVDLKSIDVADGSTFLLCSDGIIRHVTDDEIEHILAYAHNLDAACATLKQICFERGAEDNLTAVIVRLGQNSAADNFDLQSFDDTARDLDEEITVTQPRPSLVPASRAFGAPKHETASAQTNDASSTDSPAAIETHTDDSPLASSPRKSRVTYYASEDSSLHEEIRPARRSWLSNLLLGLLAVLIVGGFGALAFYIGTSHPDYFRPNSGKGDARNIAANPATNQTPALDPSEAAFERRRREIDRAPGALARQLEQESNGHPFDSSDPSFLYLYGRALLLSGKTAEARQAFDKAIPLLEQRQPTGRESLKIEARLATAAAALKSNDPAAMLAATKSLEDVIEKER